MMSNDDFGERVLHVGSLLLDPATRGEALTEARRVKEDMSRTLYRQNLLLNTLDHLIASFAPMPDWPWGYLAIDPATGMVLPQAESPRPKRYERRARTLDHAGQISAETGKPVSVAAIIGKLRQEGEDLNEKSLSTAVGNILTRSQKWQRVGQGEYEPIERV